MIKMGASGLRPDRAIRANKNAALGWGGVWGKAPNSKNKNAKRFYSASIPRAGPNPASCRIWAMKTAASMPPPCHASGLFPQNRTASGPYRSLWVYPAA
jgi:hypothetical protein